MQCEHLHQSSNSQKPTELVRENVSGSSLMGARRMHHVALLERRVSHLVLRCFVKIHRKENEYSGAKLKALLQMF